MFIECFSSFKILHNFKKAKTFARFIRRKVFQRVSQPKLIRHFAQLWFKALVLDVKSTYISVSVFSHPMLNFRGLFKVKLLKQEGAICFYNYDSHLLFSIFYSFMQENFSVHCNCYVALFLNYQV